jgi:hypothetical protein
MYDRHPLLAEAHANLDLAGSVLAQGASVAPDFTMRSIQAMRERLHRHQPAAFSVCSYCSDAWPCIEVLTDFRVLGIDQDDELPSDA